MKKKMKKKAIAPLLIFWVAAGVAALWGGGFFLSQLNKTTGASSGIPVYIWIIIGILALIALKK